ncbi:uncharacterized protein LOC133186528 [Saccostrea echinata]|uniref:uncharacterized protein LOC133186528 n=1 Tax=Saccostrea echinata TaxID=191078 RepID=UPI002A83867F|nr:uncharacterized protein LOC133186528 [Saccostrea echinata]
MFDEDFDILAVYYNVSDDGSGINRIDFGLGKSKHDIEVRGYVRRNHMNRFDPYFVVENLDLKPGVPAWIRVRAVNNVDQFASGHAPQPIMVDKTPPIVGVVSDGNKLRRDLQYQHETNKICAQWTHFYDPESGIKEFIWGVGSAPELDDIVPFRNFSHHTKMGCAEAILKHNKTYYSTVIAFNDALNSKKSNGSSDGVLIDVTPPDPGFVNDGIDQSLDKNFTSESATVRACWENFTDLESHIADYKVNIYVNKELKKSFNMEQEKIFEDHSFSLHHLDFVSVEIETKNGAELKIVKSSDGVLVDHTPPNVIMIRDCLSGNGYQADDKNIFLRWKFEDQESDIKEYRVLINRLEAGQKLKIWPENMDYQIFESSSKEAERYNISLSLASGYKYFAHITAINRADLSTTHESNGVVIDITPPTLIKVHIGEIKEEEELDENGYILHDSPSSMTISWKARDFESNPEKIFVAIGTESNIQEELPWFTIDGEKASVLIENLNIVPTAKSNKTYIVSVKVKNRAGLVSKIVKSKPIYVQSENVPGIIFDGRNLLKAEDYQIDKTSIAMSFTGFESEACNIIGYNWAVGSSPYFTDILPYTEYGIVLRNKTVGHAQIHLKLFEAETYFVTVRAKTGHNCRESYIVSTSNGIKIDSSPPKFVFIHNTKSTSLNIAIFQKSLDSIDLKWEVNDLSLIVNQSVALRKQPFSEDIWHSNDPSLTSVPAGSVQLETGQVLFLTINSTDSAGLSNSDISPPIMIDNTIPSAVDFKCTPVISVAKSLVECSWLTLIENESKISKVQLAVGTQHLIYNIMNFTEIPKFRYTWIRDFKAIIKDRDISKIYISIKISNILGNFLRLEFPIDVDRTEPEGGEVYFVTSTRSGGMSWRKQECQQPVSYAEISLKNFKDEETALEKIEVGLGTLPGITNILDYVTELYSNYTFLNDVALPVGKMVYATVRVFNSVGLFKAVVSDPVAISPNPSLSVIDGYSPTNDEDFQHRTSEMSGKWIYSDPCRVVKAVWAIEDIEGNVVQNFTNIQGARTHFFNDELLLRNGKTYINIIRITDALQRTFLSRSDGIAVRIQPPDPGFVRDGLGDDLDYQASSNKISANWDIFGNDMKKDPTQTIVKYMVAIGNDRRYSYTRSNVHTFVDVGLNKTYTFTHLNLTEKTVTYYVSVKAISLAGSEQESTSDGVRVGFRNGITPGKIHYDRFQAMTDKINVFWSNFGSDLGIRQYYVAIGSSKTFFYNDTSDCSVLSDTYAKHFDVLLPKGCGLNTYVTIDNLQLRHGSEYFITGTLGTRIG